MKTNSMALALLGLCGGFTVASAVGVSLKDAAAEGESYTVTLPADADLQINTKTAHFVDFTPVAPVETVVEGDVKKVTFKLPTSKVYNYRTSMPGRLTRAGHFKMDADAAKRPALKFSESDYDSDPATVNHDPKSNAGYETGDIFININERGHLSLTTDSTFMLHAMRTWELTDNTVNNYFIEPDFHYTVIGLDGNPSDDVVAISSDPGSAWARLKAVGEGEAIVLVTYDAIALNYYSGTDRKDFTGGEFWGAIWPENTAAFVVSVGAGESAVEPNMFLNEEYNTDALRLAGKNVDAEHDVFYYLDTEEGARYTFKPENVAEVSIAYPSVGERMASYSGFGQDGVTRNEDGSYTLLLRHGRQIVRLADAAGNAVYQVLTAKECHREVVNATRPGSSIFLPGDKVKVQYSGLYHPANKIAGIYNMSAYVTYNGTPNGNTLYQTPNQYTFASAESAQAMTFEIPADYDTEKAPVLMINEGVIQVNGFGDPVGNHRNTDPTKGRLPNFNAVSHKTYFGMIPDVEIPVSAIREFAIKTSCDVEGAEISVSYNGVALTPDAEGLYSGTYGSYSVVAVKDGYRCYRGQFEIGDEADGLQTFVIEMERLAPGAWDGSTKTEPATVEGVYQISTGAELAWFADKVNGGAAASDAVLLNDIDLGNFNWTPIGTTPTKAFSGTFSSKNHTVEGLYIENPTAKYQGLFGYAKGTAAKKAVISGVTVKGSVSAKSDAGGIVGYMAAYSEVDRCANLADVTVAANNCGGVAGYMAANTRLTNCYNKGRITGVTGNTGGVVGGHFATAAVENVFHLGKVSCPKSAGACVGGTTAKTKMLNLFAIDRHDVTTKHTLVTDEQMRSGEVAYRLGAAFGQEIGLDEHPVFDGTEVKYDPVTDQYYNREIPTSVGDLDSGVAVPELYYNLEGIPSATPWPGLNLVRMSDGTILKHLNHF